MHLLTLDMPCSKLRKFVSVVHFSVFPGLSALPFPYINNVLPKLEPEECVALGPTAELNFKHLCEEKVNFMLVAACSQTPLCLQFRLIKVTCLVAMDNSPTFFPIIPVS